jgi:hypothetical protein
MDMDRVYLKNILLEVSRWPKGETLQFANLEVSGSNPLRGSYFFPGLIPTFIHF